VFIGLKDIDFMKIDSLDPRVNRADLPAPDEYVPKAELDQWETWEVMHQTSRGAQHIHVGSVHAPNAELAIVFAKEQYARRMKCVNLWVVRTSAITATSYDDADMFEPATDKSYREAFGYKNKHLIQKFNEERAKAGL
jgi:ring-1,2-phenylacetyl-CoA epoxidase subunit PaaB